MKKILKQCLIDKQIYLINEQLNWEWNKNEHRFYPFEHESKLKLSYENCLTIKNIIPCNNQQKNSKSF